MSIQRISLCLIGLLCANFAVPVTAAEPKLEYNRDIRPILAENCFQCHGADSAARKAELRLDQREAALESGAIVAAAPNDSELIARIFSSEAEEQMPPPATKKTLTAEEKEILKRWVAEGAEYQPHWSFLVPQKTDPPAVKQKDWVRNPIDNFILARLEAAGLSPAPEADRRTLARRLSLDLTGLPPHPELVEAFVQDKSADAYEKLVDKLMAMPQWGEHRARYWLDAARYADTHGIHFDNYREMWTYRDWVIKAFNQNMTFDQFTIEQLAGDMLPEATLDQKIASGFNRCNITTNEGGIIDEEYRVLYARDRTETVGLVWMGMTVGCAVCHDHKFDPISQKEFYALSAFFNNTTQAVKDGNVKDTPPIVPVPLNEDRDRWQALKTEVPAAEKAMKDRRIAARSDFDHWLVGAKPANFQSTVPTEDLYLHAPLTEGEGKILHLEVAGKPVEIPLADSAKWQPAGEDRAALIPNGAAAELPEAGNFEKDQPLTTAAWVKTSKSAKYASLIARMDDSKQYQGWDIWIQDRRIGSHIIHSWPKAGLKVVAKEAVPVDTWTHVSVTYDGSGKAAGLKVYYNGKPQQLTVEKDQLTESSLTTVPLKIGQRDTNAKLSDTAIQDLRLYTRALPAEEVSQLANASRFGEILAKDPASRTKMEQEELYNWWLSAEDKTYPGLMKKFATLKEEKAQIQVRGTIAHVMNESDQAAMAYVLHRGEYAERRDEVKPITPASLPGLPESYPKDRLGLAQWLLLPEHPLTARVTVNRFWQQLFGTGLVSTAGDFGVMGALPSHPELLDWLAVDFRAGNWDIKRFFKQAVMSAAYRQQAVTTPEKLDKDVDNRLLSRGPRFRMDAEMVRDYALATSGLLVKKIGGPSVKPYQPPGVWEAVAMIGSNTRDYKADQGENLYRRSMYTFWKRSAPPASMDIFNAPSREVCSVQRERTNTPLQALVTMNDPQFIEAARVLATELLTAKDLSLEQRTDALMERLASRPLRDAERSIVTNSLAELTLYYMDHADEAKQLTEVGDSPRNTDLNVSELAAWTMLANELMNLDEVLNK